MPLLSCNTRRNLAEASKRDLKKVVQLEPTMWEKLLELLDDLGNLADTAAVVAYEEYKRGPSTARP
jgi:hypothetical protein